MEFIQLGVMAIVLYQVTLVLRDKTLAKKAYSLIPGIRLRHFALSFVGMGAVIGAYTLLAQIPLLSWGWWTLLGGEGNVATGTTTNPTVVTAVAQVILVSVVTLALPILAYLEELAFRRGAEHRSRAQNLSKAVVFGLLHLIMGIPLALGIALTFGGIVLTYAYLRGYKKAAMLLSTTVPHPSCSTAQDMSTHSLQEAAIDEAARTHIAWNATLFTLLWLSIALGVLSW